MDFTISHPRLPFPLLLYMATLTVVHQTYTEEGMLLLPMPLWVWGTDSEKHPLLHFLTKPSQCHQPQDHEGHQQIPANPNPLPPTTISLKSKLIKSLELIWEKVWENQGKFTLKSTYKIWQISHTVDFSGKFQGTGFRVKYRVNSRVNQPSCHKHTYPYHYPHIPVSFPQNNCICLFQT